MRIAVTGATGFLGRYIVNELVSRGHDCCCWCRPTSDRDGFDNSDAIEWVSGSLGDERSVKELLRGCDAVVHAALMRVGQSFRGGEGGLSENVKNNLLGSLQLIESAQLVGAERFVFISTCAVHECILDDRSLDETHPLWPTSHYGAHKAAIEKFVHSFGLGMGFPVCALRPTGIYGVARPVKSSKWFEIVRSVVRNETVECRQGGKEVHARDVAKAVSLLLGADGTAGQAYNCYDMYISEYDVAIITQRLADVRNEIIGGQTRPKNQIVTDKIHDLGMEFGGRALLESTIASLVEHAKMYES